MKNMLRTVGCASAVLALALAGCRGEPPPEISGPVGDEVPVGGEVTDADLARPAGAEWLHHHGDWSGTRHSTLTELNPSNVHELEVAWTFSTATVGNNQASPIFHDGILYFTSYDQKVFAVDARTGDLIWKYEHELPEDFGGMVSGFLGTINKGVAIYRDKVYFFTNDTKLIAFHYKTGEELWRVQVRQYVKNVGEDQKGYWTTIAPLVIPGKVILGLSGGEQGGLPGYLDALDPETGETLWSANMIPVGDEPGAETWPGDSAATGGVPLWITGTYDPELNLVFTGTGNAFPWNAMERLGDNVGAASIAAVNATTGKVVWRYQVVPGDPFDFDAAQAPLIIDIDGRKTIVQANKTGFMHYVDAKTGEFLRAVRISDKINWAEGYDAKGRPYGQIALPEVGGDAIEVWPSLLGAVNLYPSAYNPKTGMIYLATQDMGMLYGYDEVVVTSGVKSMGASLEFIEDGQEIDRAFNVKSGEEVWRDARPNEGFAGGMLTTAGNLVFYGSADGHLNAVNATTGEKLWSYRAGITFKSAPITYELDGRQYVAQLAGGLQLGKAWEWLQTAPDGGMLFVFSR